MKKLITVLIAMIMMISMSVKAFAADSEVKERLQVAIESYCVSQQSLLMENNNDENFIFQNLTISIDESKLTKEKINELNSMSDDELLNYVESAYQMAADGLNNAEVKYSSQNTPRQARTQWSQDRYGDVWCGVPNIGWAYIRMYYNVQWTDNGTGFNGATYYDSWKTNGVTIGSWEPHYGSAAVKSSALVEVTSTGTITYGIPDTVLSASFDATFLHEDTAPYAI